MDSLTHGQNGDSPFEVKSQIWFTAGVKRDFVRGSSGGVWGVSKVYFSKCIFSKCMGPMCTMEDAGFLSV